MFVKKSVILIVLLLVLLTFVHALETRDYETLELEEVLEEFLFGESDITPDLLVFLSKHDLVRADKEVLYRIYNSLGSHYYYAGELELSTEYFKKCIPLAKILEDKELLADTYVYIGVNYDESGHKQIGLENYLKGARLYSEIGNEIGYGLAQHNIGVVYQTQKQFDKALESYHESLAIELKHDNINGAIYSLYTIAVLHYLTETPDSMLYYLEEYEKRLGLFRDNYIKNHKYFLRGNYYSMIENHVEAEMQYKKAVSIFEEFKYSSPLISALAELGHCQIKLGKLNDAEKNLMRAEHFADSLKLHYVELRIFDNMHKLYLAMGDYEEASYYSIKYANLIKDIYQDENSSLLSEYQIIWETEKRESQIALLRKDNEIQRLKLIRSKFLSGIIAFVLLFSAILLIVLARQSRYRKRTNLLLQSKNKELAVSNATKDKFFKIIAHDLKNPLSAFRNISGMIDENLNTLHKDELSEYMQELRKSSDSLNELLNNLLQWAISQTDSIRAELVKLSLKNLMDENIFQLQSIAKLKNVNIINQIDENLVVKTDKNIFITITRNLISNAIKFSSSGSSIEIRALIKESSAEIHVKDYGIGIDESDIDKLFRIEENPQKIGNSPEKGTGLGLILSKELADAINSNLSVISKKGEGSTFILSIPV
jgi:signal transduction histidine kinase